MSEFLMVVPEGWTEVPDADAWVHANDDAYLAQAIVVADWTGISQALEDGGYIAPNTVVQDARLFNAAGVFRFWYRL